MKSRHCHIVFQKITKCDRGCQKNVKFGCWQASSMEFLVQVLQIPMISKLQDFLRTLKSSCGTIYNNLISFQFLPEMK